jgi:hypothetical protein
MVIVIHDLVQIKKTKQGQQKTSIKANITKNLFLDNEIRTPMFI